MFAERLTRRARSRSHPTAARPAPRGPGERLASALVALGELKGGISIHREMPWASITFAGTRHHVTMCFNGDGAIEAGERFIAALPDHEFAIPGQIVAEAQIVKVEHELLPDPKLRVRMELLLLDEG